MSERRRSNQLSLAVENQDFDVDWRVLDDARGRDAGGRRDGVAQVYGGFGREAERVRCGVRVRYLSRQRFVGAAGLGGFGEGLHVDPPATRMQVEEALRQFGHLGDAAGDRDAIDGVLAQVFQHAADEVAHVNQGGGRQAVMRGDRGVGLTLGEWLGPPEALPVALRPIARRPGRGEYRRAASFVGFVVARLGRAALCPLLRACGRSGRQGTVVAICRDLGDSLGAVEAAWQAVSGENPS